MPVSTRARRVARTGRKVRGLGQLFGSLATSTLSGPSYSTPQVDSTNPGTSLMALWLRQGITSQVPARHPLPVPPSPCQIFPGFRPISLVRSPRAVSSFCSSCTCP
ncbi:hypothetical protein MRX96_037172 [Rhipicephalus microplus]